MEQLGNISAIVLGVLAFGAFLYAIFKWKVGTDKDIAYLRESANADRATFNTIATEIREDIKKLLLRSNPRPPIVSQSPYPLTEFGEEIAKEVEAFTWANQLAHVLLPEIRGMEPFEIDEFCKSYVPERITDELRRRIAMCAYEMGTEKSDIELALEVVLRDALLQLIK